MYLPTTLHERDVTQGQFSNGFFNLEFSFSFQVPYQGERAVLPEYLLIIGERIVGCKRRKNISIL